MNSLLPSWDDIENPDIAQAAQQSLSNLDVHEAQKELDEQAALFEKQKQLKQAGLQQVIPTALGTTLTPEHLSDAAKQLFHKAQLSIQEMDRLIEAGGRVTVDEKRLLNCKSDLNQLVPFKFPWAWSLYLTATEQHWMPAECDLYRAADSFAAVKETLPKKMLARFYLNYRYRERILPEAVLLNCYRLITNPECRQYVLRQGFESAAIRHLLSDIKSLFKLDESSVNQPSAINSVYASDGKTFQARYLAAANLVRNLHDFTFETKAQDMSTSNFLEELIYIYGYVNWIMQIVPTYQLIQALGIAGLEGSGLSKSVFYLIRDMQTQSSFIQLFLCTAFEENPEVLTPEFKARVINHFSDFVNLECDLAATLVNTDSEFKDVIDVVRFYTAEFLGVLGIEFPAGTLTPATAWYIDLVNQARPHVDLEAGLSGQGGNLNW